MHSKLGTMIALSRQLLLWTHAQSEVYEKSTFNSSTSKTWTS